MGSFLDPEGRGGLTQKARNTAHFAVIHITP
jgi:hypothetical protein